MKNFKIIFWQFLMVLPIFLFAQEQTYKEAMDAKLVNVNRAQMTKHRPIVDNIRHYLRAGYEVGKSL